MPEASKLEPPAGEWLFKLHDEVLGPVPAVEIIEKMFTGEVDESTGISLAEGEWQTIQAVRAFHPFLYQAKAKIRAQRARLEAERAARKRKNRNMINVGIGAAILVALSFVASYLIIVNRPWRGGEVLTAWAARHVPLLSISAAGAATRKSAEDDSAINIDQILIDDAPTLVAIRATKKKKKHPGTKKIVEKPEHGGKTGKQPKEVKIVSTGKLSNEEITGLVYSKSNLRRLYGCLQREIRRNNDLASPVVIDFTIANDGHISRVRMDSPGLDGGSLHRCFRQKLTSLKFRAFSGQVRNVTMPFNFKR
ncbi:MAG TPA: AgmX/PglI C-terminal domain-containing protein [Myxococcota bacterium]|nr:AgmX/PglI C-terminal domain-containing protein [Myxococcota bacterium]